MTRDIVILLCNRTMALAQPWLDRGYFVVMVDPQHPAGVTTEGRLTRIGCRIVDAAYMLGDYIRSGRVYAVFGMPPCTDVAVSGTKHWKAKRERDPYFQAKAAIVAEQCRMVGMLSGAMWWWENPKGAFLRIFGPATHCFHPFQFTSLCPADNYTKETFLWAGGGFVMPDECPLPDVAAAVALVKARTKRLLSKPTALERDLWSDEERAFLIAHYPDDRIHKCGRSDDRGDIRSETPTGFSLANCLANFAPLPTQLELVA